MIRSCKMMTDTQRTKQTNLTKNQANKSLSKLIKKILCIRFAAPLVVIAGKKLTTGH